MKIAKKEEPLQAGVGRLGDPSAISCPECHGVLLQVPEGSHFRYRCHTGHAYSAESLLAEIQEYIEISLWNTIRAMQEGQILMRAMAEQIAALHESGDCGLLRQRSEELNRHTNLLRRLLNSSVNSGAPPVDND